MDINFWSGIIIAAFISVPISIIANLYSDSVRQKLDRWKGIRLSKELAREIQRYRLVAALREGVPTETIQFQLRNHMVTRDLIIAFVNTGTLIIIAVFVREIEEFVPRLAIGLYCMIASFLTFFLMINAAFGHWRMGMTLRRLERFDVYVAKIRAKWGDSAIQVVPATPTSPAPGGSARAR